MASGSLGAGGSRAGLEELQILETQAEERLSAAKEEFNIARDKAHKAQVEFVNYTRISAACEVRVKQAQEDRAVFTP